LEGIDSSDAGGILKAIETFAVECSINKVATSEALAYAVDEAVQVFGGNGYSREFPVERAYRDARITRIYEGTNEINRLIIATRLLKNAELRLTDAGDVNGHASVLQAEYDALAHVKRLARASLGAIAQAFGPNARDQQELLGHAANTIIECYAIESALGRAEKMHARRGDGAAIALDAARVYTCDAIDRAAHAGKQIQNALSGQDDIDQLRSIVARVNDHPGTDSVAARRRIADTAIAQSRYPF
ncbi:MAG TPA: acyl-CoA dehydrogenase family protein, partial [Vicinamibacterales bacterium]|nr:acyl-CoA dehydrogenase family protein [Vicinamibacterales bacterium]